MIEFGTRTHPYKNLGFVFVELLNYHSHTDRNISIYVKENTQNYLHIYNNDIVNITYVEIVTYSDNETAVPEKAYITALEHDSLVDSPGTSLNILKNYDLRIAEAIDNNSDITDSEKAYIEQSKYLILIVRSNFLIDGFVMYSEFDSLHELNLFFVAVYLQSRLYTAKNLDFRSGGAVFETIFPLNMHLENIDIDYTMSLGGFQAYEECNYPEAELNTLYYVKNLTAYYGSERLVIPTRQAVLETRGAPDMIVEDFY